MYIGVRICVQRANANVCACVSTHLLFLNSSIQCKSCFLPSLCFSKSIICLSHFFFIPLLSLFTPHSCRKCNHVRGCGEGKEGDHGGRKRGGKKRDFEANVGKRKKKAFVCVPNYHSSQPKVTFAENGRTRSQNSYFHPASSVCVCVLVTVVMR